MSASAQRRSDAVTIPQLLSFFELIVYAGLILAAAAGPLDGLYATQPWAVGVFGTAFIAIIALFIGYGRSRPGILLAPRSVLILTLFATLAVHTTTAYDLPAAYPFTTLHILFYAVLIVFGAAGSIPLFSAAFCFIIIGELIPVGRYLFSNIESEGVFQTLGWQLGKMLPVFGLMGSAGLLGLFMAPFRVVVKKVDAAESPMKKTGKNRSREELAPAIPPPQESVSMDYDPSKSGVYSIDEGEFRKMRDLTVSDELRSLVYFMYKNFGAFSALCFIYDPQQRVFTINACESRGGVNIKTNARIPAGSGVVGNIAVDGRTFMSGDIMQYNTTLGYYSQPESIYSILAVPIISYDEHHRPKELLGALVIDSKDKLAFRDNHKDTLNRFAMIAAALITNIRGRLYQQRAAEQFQVFYEAGRHFVNVHKADDVLDTLFRMITDIAPFTRVVEIECHAETGMYTIRKIAGNPGEIKEGMTFPLNDGLYSTAMKNRNIIYFPNYEVQRSAEAKPYYRFIPEEPLNPDTRSFIILPLSAEDESYARCLISVENATPNMYQGEAGKVLATLVSNASVAYQKALLYQKMELLATTDGLTLLFNHRTFQENLHREIIRAHRYQHPLSLLLLDIDHFKKFNDTYGHQIGDLVLQEVANCLRKVVREHDIAARYGGEEFVVIIPETASVPAASIADRIRKTIETHAVFVEGTELHVSVSIGCATIPEHAGTQAELIEKADKAMYVSKKNGRNQVTIYDKTMG